ncbi:MAG: DUF1329 domain-containing protein [Candidatus Binatia bacterium]
MSLIVEPQLAFGSRFTAGTFCMGILFLLFLPLKAGAEEAGLKPGDTIGPHNWRVVKEMVGQNLLNRIKKGYTFQIKEAKIFKPPREYIEATEKYSGRVRLGPNGELLNYVLGLPFPKLDRSDPQAGQKLAWNFYWRWLGDNYKTGGATKTGQIIRYAIEKSGAERRADLVSYTMFPRTRYMMSPKPVLQGYEHIDWIQLRVVGYPRDSAGVSTLGIRYADPNRADDLYLYIPSIRRIRRATTTQRCQTLAPSEFNLDDINSFNGKITDFNYKFLGEKKVLTNFTEQGLPFRRKKGDYLPLDEKWEVQEVYVLEITPKDPSYCYPRKVLWIDKTTWESTWTMIWDKKGELWKEQFAFRTPVKLPDGREVWSVGTVVIVNVQNGRSTLVTAVRAHNRDYPPSLWSLATMQRMMRGGSVE